MSQIIEEWREFSFKSKKEENFVLIISVFEMAIIIVKMIFIKNYLAKLLILIISTTYLKKVNFFSVKESL